MSFMLSSPPGLPRASQPPPSSPLSPRFGSFSPIPRTPTRHRQYKNRDFSSPTLVQENPRKTFLREQFKKRCIERAQKARHDQVRSRRASLSSDGFDYDDDAEMEESENQNSEDDVLNDEVCWGLAPSASVRLTSRPSCLGALWLAPGTNNDITFV